MLILNTVEFANLHAFHAHVRYVSTCLRALRAYLSTCLKLLRGYVPTCARFSRAYVLTCLYIIFVPTCLCAYVRSFFPWFRAYNHSQNILKLTSIPCIAVFLWII